MPHHKKPKIDPMTEAGQRLHNKHRNRTTITARTASRLGVKGGVARAKSLTAARRREIALMGVKARLARAKKKDKSLKNRR